MKHGAVTGVIDLGGGNDTFKDGARSETLADGDGTDSVKLGAGNDTYRATGNTGSDGTDTIDGGKGIDTYDASFAAGSVQINFDTAVHGAIAANRATGANAVGSIGLQDNITGFDNAKGGGASDTIHGSASANTLDGGAGSDTLAGFGGKDILTGGDDADTFEFWSIKHSGVTKATRDVINDFSQAESDQIELSLIDADTTQAGDQAFAYIGANVLFGGNAGELRSYFIPGGQIIEGDVNGDGKADFSIEVSDANQTIVWSATDGVDFLL